VTGRSPPRAPAGAPTRLAIAGRLLRPFLPAVAAVPILVLTLRPGPETAVNVGATPLCLVCGARGMADVLLNIPLFVPFGWALGAIGWRPRRALAVGFALSLTIELVQFLLPHRFPGIGDVIYNAAGTWLGATLWAVGSGWLRPAARHPAARLWGWGAAGVASLVAVPLLLAPAFQTGGWVAHRAPKLSGHDVFRGPVLDVRVAGHPIAEGPIARGDSVRRWLLRGTEVDLRFRRDGIAPRYLAPIFTLTRGEWVQMLVVGIDDQDLVVRYRTRSERLLLDGPDLRDYGRALDWSEGDAAEVTVSAVGAGVAVSIDGSPPRRLTVPTARGWAFLLYGARLDRRWGTALDLAWMASWAVPLGLWGVGWRALGPAALWAALLLTLPLASPVLSAGWAGVAGVLLGVSAGRVARAIVERALGPGSRDRV